MRILAGSIVRQQPEVLKAHLDTMVWQKVNRDIEVDYLYINDLDIDEPTYAESRDVLYDSYPELIEVHATQGRPSGAEYTVGDITHGWNEATFGWLGHIKQDYLNYARAGGYDAVFLVDSDLLLDPYTLQCLIDNDVDICSAVFWTSWMPGMPEQPQVWQRHPYDLDGGIFREHEFIRRLRRRELLNVGGLGACTLIKLEGTEAAAYFPFLDDLPHGGMWQGEDRHFCVRANRAHISLFGDGWSPIEHLYRPMDSASIRDRVHSLDRRRPKAVSYDNWVRLRLQPMEIQGWVGYAHVRGRLGQLKLLPELEAEVMQIPVGESAIVKTHFPLWWPVEQLRGQSQLIKLDVMDAFPYSVPETRVENRPFYTPAQMAEMRNARIYSKVPKVAEAVQVSRNDSVPEADMAGPEPEGGE